MKRFIPMVMMLLCLSLFPEGAQSRSGCCSRHGGVCGCECCDGSSLSAKCAPYYPSCNDTPQNAPEPTPRCMSHSTYNDADDTCYCDDGYYPSGTKCLAYPSNSQSSDESNGWWQCNDGYIENGNKCISLPENSHKLPSSDSEWECNGASQPNAPKPTKSSSSCEYSLPTSQKDIEKEHMRFGYSSGERYRNKVFYSIMFSI